jgi:Ca-activated chloride channel family protein
MPSLPHDSSLPPDSSLLPDSATSAELPWPSDGSARRRLMLGGASLLALGVVLNASRFVEPEAFEREDAPAYADHRETKSEAKSEAGHRHRGEEGKMGRPTSKNKSGLYAMKGPRYAVPSAPEPSSSSEDVWGGLTGSEVGQSMGVGGLGLVGTGRGGGGTGEGTIGLGSTGVVGKRGGSSRRTLGVRSDQGRPIVAEPTGGTLALPPGPSHDTGFIAVAKDPLSTFSVDVDTASYSATRRSLVEGRLPDPDSVRIEELVNYFDYDYAAPTGDVPFSVTAEVGECPWNPEHELVHVGLQGKVIAPEDLPPRNLVFLVDVSGSMSMPDKLPLVQRSLAQLVPTLRAADRISLVVYAGAAGVVLPPTPGSDKDTILAALARLEAGGSTNGAEGIEAAYAQAHAAFMEDGVNRVILASDGDFNVGVSSHEALVEMIESQRKSGIELSVLGYGMGHRDHTMEQLADKGNGNYAYIDGAEEAHKVLVEEAGGTLVTIAKDVKIQVELDPTRVLSYRLVGYENRRLAHQDFADDTKDAGEIGAGHSVTALYEVVPRRDAPADAPWMTLSLRHKLPKGDESSLLRLPVVAEPRAAKDTSDDFRFSAAVATFGMLLRGDDHGGPPDEVNWVSTQALARAALGDDASCRRHRFVELVGRAGRLAGDVDVSTERLACTAELPPTPGEELPTIVRDPSPEPDHAERSSAPDSYYDGQAFDGSAFGAWVLEVLRLLPPLLALPLFIMALRRPRRWE